LKGKETMEEKEKTLEEILYTQTLLLEMLGDIYEVAMALGARVGVSVQPVLQVREYLENRSEK
jgi:hypothetical protein